MNWTDIDWVEVSAVFRIDTDGDVSESYGYAYDADGNHSCFWASSIGGGYRGVDAFSFEIMNSRPHKITYEGAILYSPRDKQVDEAVLDPEELK